MNEVTFNPETHEYLYKGSKIPCVSDIVKFCKLQDFSQVPPAILERAVQFGTNVHKTIELYDKDVLDFDALDEALRPPLEGWKSFVKDTGAKIIESELIVFSKKYGYAGTLDKIVEFHKGKYDGSRAVLDIKTKTKIDKACHLQVDGYLTAYNEEHKKKATCKLILQITKDGEYKIHDSNDAGDLGIFKSAATIYNWCKNK